MDILFSVLNYLMENHLLVLVILLGHYSNDHRHYLIHLQVINVDIVLIIYYQSFHLVIVQNTARLRTILVEVAVKLVIVHQVLPDDHHHQQFQLHQLSSEFFLM